MPEIDHDPMMGEPGPSELVARTYLATISLSLLGLMIPFWSAISLIAIAYAWYQIRDEL